VTARWVDPVIRKAELAPYGRDAETKTLALLDSALLEKPARAVTDVVVKQLQQAAPRDVRELLPHLQARAQEYANDAVEKLMRRADAEAKAMREILELQQKHLEKKVVEYDHNPQFILEFSEEEKRQAKAERRVWEERLAALPEELKTEPDRIRSLYEVRAQRIEPIGLIYLWPVTR
jgi:hypothetical protein